MTIPSFVARISIPAVRDRIRMSCFMSFNESSNSWRGTHPLKPVRLQASPRYRLRSAQYSMPSVGQSCGAPIPLPLHQFVVLLSTRTIGLPALDADPFAQSVALGVRTQGVVGDASVISSPDTDNRNCAVYRTIPVSDLAMSGHLPVLFQIFSNFRSLPEPSFSTKNAAPTGSPLSGIQPMR